MPEHTPRAAEELREVANAARRIPGGRLALVRNGRVLGIYEPHQVSPNVEDTIATLSSSLKTAEQERDALWSKAVDVTLAQDGDPAELTAAIEALSEVTLAVLGREMDSIAASLGMGCTDG